MDSEDPIITKLLHKSFHFSLSLSLLLVVAGDSFRLSSSSICNNDIRAKRLISKSLNCFEYGDDKM